MDDELIANFTAFTSATPELARQYLTLTESNLEQAVQLYFDSGGADMGASMPQQPAAQPASRRYNEDNNGVVTIDSDDDEAPYEDDEAMARRLQQEAYGTAGGEEDVRAPMARTTETLVGPGSTWVGDDGDDIDAAVQEQMMARQRRANTRPGIFNQVSVWDDANGLATPSDPEAHRRNLARATGGASEQSSKSTLLAELFRPPTDLISPLSFQDARDEGKEDEKWIIVNVQDPSIFDCQVLNRDIWKNSQIKETVQENFIFLQYSKDDPRGNQYVQYYFQNRDSDDAYPHIAIVDPRTGEQVKVWSGAPVPKPADFLMDLHEFLDRYSLKAFAKNPVATRKPEKKSKDVERMSEEEMLEMAMQNSLQQGGAAVKDDDPDALTKAESSKGNNTAVDPDAMDIVDTGVPIENAETEPSASQAGPFAQIASDKPHTEPTDPASSTRIQFRYSGGRQIRRFGLQEEVRRMYEWLKASPVEGKQGVDFEFVFMGRNLIEALDQTIEEAGLKNGSVMIEFIE
ncbi:hypothetical protein E4T50_10335 [Aureobasidium sp. EXF-12298]|nr:hypothetical protein E4T50_10335 [Aureobasidium sp. EXF-12298]KAI4756965.1 hypothetical protein E4T51_09964 [Aureobasidium sp. EXF-12344]KAI4773952.1 hypothetical protein E4T52_11071 [Aureobasidium sp. EXF-3400]